MLTSDLGHEVQEASFFLNYVDENANEFNGVEYSILVKENVSEADILEDLKNLKITEYTIDIERHAIQISDFDDYKKSKSKVRKNVAKLIKKLGGNVNGTNYRKVRSEYYNIRDRQSAYRTWLAANEVRQQQSGSNESGVYTLSEETLESIRQALTKLENSEAYKQILKDSKAESTEFSKELNEKDSEVNEEAKTEEVKKKEKEPKNNDRVDEPFKENHAYLLSKVVI